jgi:hypothetical protein
MTIVTPGGNFFPIPMDVNLGDNRIAEKYIEEHLLNFTKGILKSSALDVEADEKYEQRDFDLLEKFSNTRALTRHNFRDNAVESELDVVVFVHTSEKNHQGWFK